MFLYHRKLFFLEKKFSFFKDYQFRVVVYLYGYFIWYLKNKRTLFLYISNFSLNFQ